MRRISAHRDRVEPGILELLRDAGCTVFQVNAKDAPDLVIGCGGVTVLAELKTGAAKLKPGQEKFARAWQGGAIVILRSLDDALILVQRMRGRG